MKTKFLIPLIAGLASLWACKSKGGAGYEAINNTSAANRNAAADSTKLDSALSVQTKLVKTSAIRFKVKNVNHTTENILALTSKMNGMVIHHETASMPERTLDVRISNDSIMRVTAINTTAEMTLKVPSAKLEEFTNELSRMSVYVDNRSMDITNKSLEYLSAQLKLQSRNELINQQKRGKIIIKKPEAVLNLKDDMIDERINNLSINDAVKNSVVSLNLYQSNTISKEIIANDDPAAYNLPFFKRTAIALTNGWEMFVYLVIAIVNLWVLILAAAGLWILVKHYKTKKVIIVTK